MGLLGNVDRHHERKVNALRMRIKALGGVDTTHTSYRLPKAIDRQPWRGGRAAEGAALEMLLAA